jgi:TP901 family phage tail tape measure protein
MGQYFRFAGSQVSGFRKVFSTEFDTIDKVARERVKTLQTQYIKLGRDANGAMQAISVRPLKLDMNDLGTQVAMTAQKQQIFNELMKQGSTNLLNFGKNTQWAGRQLMVGFTIPLTIFGGMAAKEFMKLEEQVIRFQKVYGDFSTSAESTDNMLKSIRGLADEYTKYGVAVEKTLGLAADAAAMGMQGVNLTAQVTQATRLAVLGGVDQSQALETTTSLTNAFGVSADKLAGKINFLNAVENQTVTSIEDLTEAIPKAGPVVQQLGGDVEDLAFFLTAMKEGGINASEGANALKSGLASMINPTKQSVDLLNSFGINLEGIVDANKGDIKGTVVGFAEALNTLDPLNRAQAIEQLFGKFQFARISTLFKNVTDQASQANRVLQLTTATQEELAVVSEREMKKIEDSPMYQFQGAVERFQTSLAPIGEAFLKAVTPIINFGTEILEKFNEMGDGAKQFWTVLVAAVAGLGPVLLMTFGLLANGVANIIKMFTVMGGIFGKLSGQSTMLGSSTQYMTQEQLEAAAIAASLNQVHQNLIQTFTAESVAAERLAAAYTRAAVAAQGIIRPMMPGAPMPGGPAPKKYADGAYSVPGPKGAGDIVPAMLSPGEAVIPADKAEQYRGLIQGIIAGSIPGFMVGTDKVGDNFLEKDRTWINSQLANMQEGGAKEKLENLFVRRIIAARSKEGEVLAERFKQVSERYIASGVSSEGKMKESILSTQEGIDVSGRIDSRAIPDRLKTEQLHADPGVTESASAFAARKGISGEGVGKIQSFASLLSEAGLDNAASFMVKSSRTRAGSAKINKDMARTKGSNPGADIGEALGDYASRDSATAWDETLSAAGVDRNDETLQAEIKLYDERVAQIFREHQDAGIKKIVDTREDLDKLKARGVNTSKFASMEDIYNQAEGVLPQDSKFKNASDAAKASASQVRVNWAAGGKKQLLDWAGDDPDRQERVGKALSDTHLGGRSSQTFSASGVISDIQNEVVDAVDDAGEMASPSERIRRSGENLVAGLEDGIESGANDVKAAGKKVGGSIDPETAGRIRAEAKKAALEQEKALGINSGMAGPGAYVAPPTKPKTLVTGEIPMTAEQAAMNNAVSQGMKLRSEMSTPFTKKLGAGLEGAVEKVKSRFPKYADKIDDGISSLQRKLDLDGSFADREQKQRDLALQAQQKLTDALNERAARINAGEKNVPEVDKRLLLDKEELAAITADEVRQQKEIQKESKRQNRQKLAGRAMTAGVVATTALGAMSMAGGPAAEFAQSAMPVAGALTTILPMLLAMPPQISLVVGALALLAGAFIWFNSEMENNRKKGVEFAESLGTGSKAMKEFAEFAGKASAGEIMDKRRETQMSPFAIQSGEKTFGQSYAESEAGKKKIEDIQLNIDESSTEAAATRFATQLSMAIADGTMDVAQARSIAAALGVELDNREFTTNVIAQVNQLVGPNGENLLTDGLQVKLDIVERAQEELNRPSREREEANNQLNEMATRQNEIGNRMEEITDILNDTTVSEKERNKLNEEYNNLNAEAIQLAQERAELESKHSENVFKSAWSSAVQATQLKQNVELIQEMVDSSEVYYQKLIDQAIAIGDINAAHDLESRFMDEKIALLEKQKELYDGMEEIVASDSFKGDQTFDAQKASVMKRYEGTSQAVYADEAITSVRNLSDKENALKGDEGEVVQMQLMTMLDTGALDPQTMGNLLNIFGNAEDQSTMQAILSIGTEMAPADANMVFQMSELFKTDGEQSEFLYRFENADPAEQESLKDTFAFIQKLETSDQDLQWTMEFYNDPNNDAALKKTQKALKDLEQTPDVTVDVITQLTGASPEYLNGVVDWFNGLPEEQQKVFTSVFTSIYNTVGDRANNEAYQTWLETQTGMTDSEAAFGQYAAEQAKTVTPTLIDVTSAQTETETASDSSGGGGGGGRTGSVLDDLLQKLRRLQIATIDLTEGWAGARQALDALFPGGASNSPFQGIEQQMRRLGAKEDLISLIAGMDPEEFKKRKDELFTFDGAGNITGFRDSLLSIGAAFRSINFGTFQNEQQKNINVLRDQNQAIGKLIANGFSMAEAYEMVQDAAFASAIAQENNNDIIRQATEEYKEATKQAKLFAAAQAGTQANEDVSGRQDALTFIANNSGNLSNEVIEEILSNQEFANLIMSPNLTQAQRDILQEWIDNIENEAELELQANLTTIEGMEQIFQDGFSKAMEAFSAQEKKIELEFAVKKDPFKRTVENAQNLIADIQNRPGGMDDLQADIERISFKEEDINKRYKERLDRLQEVKRNNDRILQQRKAELTVADAITQGDIAAAAKAIEDARAQQAQANMQAQQDMLQRQKDAELEALTGQMGLTREQIEMRIRDLRQEILNIEETMLEPAQYQLSLLERQEKRQKESLTVLGMTRREWETLNNRVQVAKTSSDLYTKAMEDARDVVKKIVDYWTEIEKPKTTVHTIITNNVSSGSGGAGNIGASGDGSGTGSGNTSQPNPSTANDSTGPLTPYPTKLGTRYRNAMNSSFAKSSAGASWASNVRSKYNTWMNAENRSPGGTAAMTYAATLGTYLKSSGYNSGGLVSGYGSGDSIRAMLTPGEFVMTKPAVDAYGARMMKDINNGTFQSGSVYNYSISVNVETGANADQIANTVMRKIKSVDAKRIQGNRF